MWLSVTSFILTESPPSLSQLLLCALDRFAGAARQKAKPGRAGWRLPQPFSRRAGAGRKLRRGRGVQGRLTMAHAASELHLGYMGMVWPSRGRIVGQKVLKGSPREEAGVTLGRGVSLDSRSGSWLR